MRTVMVRYRVKPDRVQENRELIRRVFEELGRAQPAGLRYASFLLPDGVSFVHVAAMEGPENPLQAIPAFQAFTSAIAARCDEPPVATTLEPVGNYRLIAD